MSNFRTHLSVDIYSVDGMVCRYSLTFSIKLDINLHTIFIYIKKQVLYLGVHSTKTLSNWPRIFKWNILAIQFLCVIQILGIIKNWLFFRLQFFLGVEKVCKIKGCICFLCATPYCTTLFVSNGMQPTKVDHPKKVVHQQNVVQIIIHPLFITWPAG